MEVFNAAGFSGLRGSVTLAAERSNIAQPTVSKMLRLAEEEVGVALFERNCSRPCTTLGSLVGAAQRCRAWSSRRCTSSTRRPPRCNADGLQNPDVALAPSLAESLLPELAAAAQAAGRLPYALLQTLDEAAMVSGLRTGGVDFGVAYRPSGDPDIRCEVLAERANWRWPAGPRRSHRYALMCQRERCCGRTDGENLPQHAASTTPMRSGTVGQSARAPGRMRHWMC